MTAHLNRAQRLERTKARIAGLLEFLTVAVGVLALCTIAWGFPR